MATITKRFDLFDIYIEPKRKVITVRQRWQYNWLIAQGLDGWTYFEKKEYHDAVDSIIWQQWAGKYFAESTLSLYSKKNIPKDLKQYNRTRFTINFDIEWVTSNPHWTANVTKLPPDTPFKSRVEYQTNEVFLGSNDIKKSVVDKQCNLPFNTVSHEFGHTINVGDEYGTPYMSDRQLNYLEQNPEWGIERLKYDQDYKSMMNIGNELRDRFIKTIDECLDKMIDDVEFYALLTKDYVNSIGGRY